MLNVVTLGVVASSSRLISCTAKTVLIADNKHSSLFHREKEKSFMSLNLVDCIINILQLYMMHLELTVSDVQNCGVTYNRN
jgi:hypothetical protein